MTNQESEAVAVLNTRSVVGIGVCFALAAAGLFALPTLREFGLGFETAFWIVAGVELVTALGIGYFVLNLHEERG